MNRPAARLLAVLVLLAAVTALPGAARAQPKEVVIGVIYPMSGPNAQPGIDNKPVIEIGTDVANGAADLPFPFYQKLKGMPGLKGAKIRLIFADHQGKPELGQAEAERLITQEKVHALVGCWNSGVTATASQVAERYGIPFMNAGVVVAGPDAARAQVVLPDVPPRRALHPGDVRVLPRLREEARREDQDRRAHLRQHASSVPTAGRSMKELAKKYGVEVVLDLQYKERSTSLQSEVQRLKAANPGRVDADVVPDRRDPVRAHQPRSSTTTRR